MPTYTYECQKCKHTMDVFHAMTENPRVKCSVCGSTRTKRLLGTGAGIIFKGSGFYETDYKNGRNKSTSVKSESPSKNEAASKSESTTKSDSAAASGSSGKKKTDGGKAA